MAESHVINRFLYVLAFSSIAVTGLAISQIEAHWVLLLAALPLGVALVMRRPHWLYYAILGTIPLAGWSMQLPFISLSVTNVLIFLLSLILLGKQLIRTWPINRISENTRCLIVLCVWFIAASFISASNSDYPVETLRCTITILGQVLLIWVTIFIVANTERLDKTFAVIIFTGVLVSSVAFLQGTCGLGPVFGAGYIFAGRYIGEFQLPFSRSSGLFKGLGPFVVWLLLSYSLTISIRGQFSRFTRRVVQIFLIGGLLVSQTRGGWLAFGFLLIVLFTVRWWHKISRKSLFGLCVLLMLCVSIATIMFTQIFSKIARPLVEMDSKAFSTRLDEYALGVQLFCERPIMGHGRYAFGSRFLNQIGSRFELLHCTFLSVFVTYGLMGALPFFLLIFGAVWRGVLVALDKSNLIVANQAKALVVAILAVLVEANFYEAIFEKTIWLLIGLLWSLPNIRANHAIALSNNSKENKKIDHGF